MGVAYLILLLLPQAVCIAAAGGRIDGGASPATQTHPVDVDAQVVQVGVVVCVVGVEADRFFHEVARRGRRVGRPALAHGRFRGRRLQWTAAGQAAAPAPSLLQLHAPAAAAAAAAGQLAVAVAVAVAQIPLPHQTCRTAAAVTRATTKIGPLSPLSCVFFWVKKKPSCLAP